MLITKASEKNYEIAGLTRNDMLTKSLDCFAALAMTGKDGSQ
jgi:hypothetical protein